MRQLLLLASLLLVHGTDALSQRPDNLCTFDTCKSGTRAVTNFKTSDSYYSCPNRELATYVNTLIVIVSTQVFLGAQPNISNRTGEPAFEGETKAAVDSLRAKAHVHTFDQAVNSCTLGIDKRRVTVTNAPSPSSAERFASVVYVNDEVSKKAYWMPIFHLSKLK